MAAMRASPDGFKSEGSLTQAEEHAVGVYRRILCNAHPVLDGTGKSVALGVYPAGCYANHSCDPNVAISHVGDGRALVMRALRPIAQGEELCYSYLAELYQPRAARHEALQKGYYFECECRRCGEDLNKSPDGLLEDEFGEAAAMQTELQEALEAGGQSREALGAMLAGTQGVLHPCNSLVYSLHLGLVAHGSNEEDWETVATSVAAMIAARRSCFAGDLVGMVLLHRVYARALDLSLIHI
eukprot:TRINITY_DN29110_c0_g1_i1.p2 TRINITY_DN29110_c0_g1~~TRINITY_DN29110_c0_g1_i1.p2  ORF type:complete len:241 (-),score=45.65 TRINITY_DN29110_c0_g1_i1:129-851(-)